MNVGLVGCVESSFRALNTLLTLKNVKLQAVVTKDTSPQNTDYVALSPICEAHKIPCHIYEVGKEKSMALFLNSHNLDVIFCIGWSHLLSAEILRTAHHGVFGFHPAALPRNRGRHPIIWALALGLEKTASTFFQMDQGTDSGPIVSQERLVISPNDTSTSLYKKIMDTAVLQIEHIILALNEGTLNFIAQDQAKATYWRKRSRADGLIHWSMSADNIYNLVRALAPPYPGAEFRLQERYVAVSHCEKLTGQFPRDIEPGKVLHIGHQSLIVKCAGRDAVELFVQDAKNLLQIGEYL